MANKVLFGLSDAKYSVFDEEAKTYGAWVPLPGASQLSVSIEGSSDTTFADNIAYYVANKNSGYSGSFTSKMLPASFYTDVLGEMVDETTGVRYEDTKVVPKTVAFQFKVDGNENDELTTFYNVSFSRPTGDNATNEDSLTIKDISMDFKAVGRDFDVDDETKNIVKATIENTTANKTKYEAFKASVVFPGKVTGAVGA